MNTDIDIIHKNKVHTVILRFWKCWHLHLLKSYSIKTKFMIFSQVANLMHHPLKQDPFISSYIEFFWIVGFTNWLMNPEQTTDWMFYKTKNDKSLTYFTVIGCFSLNCGKNLLGLTFPYLANILPHVWDSFFFVSRLQKQENLSSAHKERNFEMKMNGEYLI